MNITGNVVIGEVKPVDIETLLDLLTAATKASVRDGSVSIGADLLMRMTRELIASKVGDARSSVIKVKLQSPDNGFNYHGSPMNPLRYYPSTVCKTSDSQEMKSPYLFTQLCGAS
ncbi:hypothetical protein AAHD62_17280 [Enterobacter hormaechei]